MPEESGEFEEIGQEGKSRHQLDRYFRRGSKKYQRQSDRIRNPSRSLIIKGPRAILGFAMLQKNRLDVGVARKNRNEFSAAISTEPDDTDGGH